MELNQGDDDTSLTLARHALKCMTAFDRFLAAAQTRQMFIFMQRKKNNFFYWATAMKVFEPPEVSLDHRLRDSPAMVEKIHQLFDVILYTLTPDTVSAHTLQSEEPPTTKKRRLSESGRAEFDRKNEEPSNTNRGRDKCDITLAQMDFTIGGTVASLWRLFYDLRLSNDSAEAIPLNPSLDKGWSSSSKPHSNHRHNTCGKKSPSSI
ncbi:hypothetical protein ARSEF1564_005427 [Beauveria bassiana]